MKFFLISGLCFISFSLLAQDLKFDFNKSLQGWASWGAGLILNDQEVGHLDKGSIRLSTDWGDVQTIYYKTGQMKEAFYKVSFYVRAQDVLDDEADFSFWHFIDTGKGAENIFTNLSGSYEWRKVEYTVKVEKDLNIWFRLKSTGTVWIDDLTINKVAQSESLKVQAPIPLKRSYTPPKPLSKRKHQKKVILNFDEVKKDHPFSVHKDSKNTVGVMTPHRFYNFKPNIFENGDWSQFDYINIDVFNPNSEFIPFSLTLGDGRSVDYWSQVNHKTTLSPGWNHLSFSLRQLLGERGSHRHLRELDLRKIQKWFVIIDPDKTIKSLKDFWIDNIELEAIEAPEVPVGVWDFNFTTLKDSSARNSIKVYTQDKFNEGKGYGFVEPIFWRVEDSVYASEDLRRTIGVLKGNFRVKLPNGKYTIFLNFERLGFWDVSFWSNREVYLNHKIVFKETRSSASDFLSDYLIFSSLTPHPNDHPYDLYLNKIFSYRKFEVEVKNGYLDLGFNADPTGISLNHLIISKRERVAATQNYVEELEKFRKNEFDRISRKVPPRPMEKPDGIKLVDLALGLREDETYPETKQSISWQAVKGETVYQLIELRGKGNVSVKLSGADQTYFRDRLKIYEVVPQLISPDLNHETYFFGGKFLRPFTKLKLDGDLSKFILLELHHDKLEKKKYTAQFSVSVGERKREFNLHLTALPFELPSIDFPVGFFGPDPLPLNYTQSESVNNLRYDLRLKAISLLAKSGFTTFTGLPSDPSSLERLINHANSEGMKGVYFSYGGAFPGSLIHEKEESVYYILQQLKAQLVYTFSDEPGGYSNRIEEDLTLAKDLKNKFPVLLRGGFSNLNDKRLSELNSYFDYGFYSHVKKAPAIKGWGSYNASPGALTDPRFVFSAGLYAAYHKGLTHYLEWHSSAIHNFPYYDLDGRESDIELFMVGRDGRLMPTLKFILAREGIQNFRKLLMIKKSLEGKNEKEAKDWLKKIESGFHSNKDFILQPNELFSFKKFHHELNTYLLNLDKN